MVQNLSTAKISLELLNKIIGTPLSTAEFKRCQEKFKYLEPKVGRFWQGTSVEAGIYIVLMGKVRLLNQVGELITTLEAGESFGHFTLFPDANLIPYAARASTNVQLCLLLSEVLIPLMAKYPQIDEYLRIQAQTFNSLLVRSKVEDKQNLSPTPPSLISTIKTKPEKKINKAYFPSPTQKIGHLLQRVTRRYSFFAQQSVSDCGAACLVMVSRYWGKQFSVNRVRDIANVDRNGASLRGLITAAESLGFNTRPVKGSLDQLARQKLPTIVHWSGNHFIVVYEITPKYVIVADPAIGQRTLTHQEFIADWTGYALLLEPTALFKDAKESTTPFWQFFELIKPHSLVMLEIFVASIFIQIFGLITPYSLN